MNSTPEISGYQLDQRLLQHPLAEIWRGRSFTGMEVVVLVLSETGATDPAIRERLDRASRTAALEPGRQETPLWAANLTASRPYAITQLVPGQSGAERLLDPLDGLLGNDTDSLNAVRTQLSQYGAAPISPYAGTAGAGGGRGTGEQLGGVQQAAGGQFADDGHRAGGGQAAAGGQQAGGGQFAGGRQQAGGGQLAGGAAQAGMGESVGVRSADGIGRGSAIGGTDARGEGPRAGAGARGEGPEGGGADAGGDGLQHAAEAGSGGVRAAAEVEGKPRGWVYLVAVVVVLLVFTVTFSVGTAVGGVVKGKDAQANQGPPPAPVSPAALPTPILLPGIVKPSGETYVPPTVFTGLFGATYERGADIQVVDGIGLPFSFGFPAPPVLEERTAVESSTTIYRRVLSSPRAQDARLDVRIALHPCGDLAACLTERAGFDKEWTTTYKAPAPTTAKDAQTWYTEQTNSPYALVMSHAFTSGGRWWLIGVAATGTAGEEQAVQQIVNDIWRQTQ
ncbi:hypothetical protein EV643_13515 [Kribbella sp. VKM Ac-2527]|uniref:Uncharacterized protein n=1 Tax=Kribbella caucasensis TaxID=2512215 RepID=A0A4R6J5J5_9ACTN|nr:hypothetical protein [Kribbella sp. VKM Ac-2527]TDO30692.1 hypothetical protein EV643_13515 [Kribbella sp. VKM Ac-2527]